MKRVKFKKIFLIFAMIVFVVGVYGHLKPIPKGVSFEGELHNGSNVEFLYDLTYQKNGEKQQEQEIFDNVFRLIEEADDYIIVDMFLFNDTYNKKFDYPTLSKNLTDKIIEKKKNNQNMHITVITDRMNTFYHSYESNHLKRLKDNEINVVEVDLKKLRDSNPVYSSIWRTAFQWFGTGNDGSLPNPFSPNAPKVTLRSYLELLNFKANHRKVILTDKQAIVSSANPHDASANHSNIAFLVEGEILKDILESEKSVAKFSGFDIDVEYKETKKLEVKDDTKVAYITEGKIAKNVLETISETQKGDEVKMGMFYFSDRKIIKELLEASERGVDIKLILDPNKDAFGIEKNGIPNRSVASELVNKSNGKIKVRWYDTNGEQYHTKMIAVKGKEETTIIGGSANYTKRNIGDFNLEANVLVSTTNETNVAKEVESYFNRIWNNKDGEYTLDYKKYQDDSIKRKMIYRFQESSGLSTF